MGSGPRSGSGKMSQWRLGTVESKEDETGEVLGGIPECKGVQRVQAAAGLSPWAAVSARDRLRLPGWFRG